MGAVSREKRSGTSRFIAISLSLAILLGSGQICKAEDELALEYKVKAGYLYNFIKFVEWPGHMLTYPDTPIAICLLGEDPFGVQLDQLVSLTAQGHPLTVKHIQTLDNLDDCHMLFICDSEHKQLKELLMKTRKYSVLTVGESPNFANQGGIIGFIAKEGRVKLEINLKAARQANIKISAKLLEVAKIVD